ncbi:MAG: type II toxin-antitoxin system VapC family toxin [Anaerolineales bacterium]|nr:type II toxin-antitoxin system VapC family toxin [Anaerolineales bacterium]
MTTYYFDSSAMVKLYVSEPGSRWVKQLYDTPSVNIDFGKIGLVEAASALARRRRMGEITSDRQRILFAKLFHDSEERFGLLTITDETLRSAAVLTQEHPLRGYDAVHLASALALNRILTENHLPSVIFASADEKLCQAAQNEGLTIENPNEYP